MTTHKCKAERARICIKLPCLDGAYRDLLPKFLRLRSSKVQFKIHLLAYLVGHIISDSVYSGGCPALPDVKKEKLQINIITTNWIEQFMLKRTLVYGAQTDYLRAV